MYTPVFPQPAGRGWHDVMAWESGSRLGQEWAVERMDMVKVKLVFSFRHQQGGNVTMTLRTGRQENSGKDKLFQVKSF